MQKVYLPSSFTKCNENCGLPDFLTNYQIRHLSNPLGLPEILPKIDPWCYIEPILLYGCEPWSMTKQTSTSIEAMEMWFLRRMLRVSWTEKRTNLEILNTASSTRKLLDNIKRRQAEFLGHVMRKGKLEHVLTTGKIRRKKKQRSSGKKHCGDVCGCKRSQKVESHDRLRLQQTRQLMMMMNLSYISYTSLCFMEIYPVPHKFPFSVFDEDVPCPMKVPLLIV